MAAEISTSVGMNQHDAPGFNEAAANGRGNPPRVVAPARVRGASMRPRRMAAEISMWAGFAVVTNPPLQ